MTFGVGKCERHCKEIIEISFVSFFFLPYCILADRKDNIWRKLKLWENLEVNELWVDPTLQQRHCILQCSKDTVKSGYCSVFRVVHWRKVHCNGSQASGNWRKVYCSAFQVVHWRKIHCSVFQATSPSLFYWMSGSCSALQNIWEKCCNVILMKSRALE